MEIRFLVSLFFAGMAITSCSSSKDTTNAADSVRVSNTIDSANKVDTIKNLPDTTKNK